MGLGWGCIPWAGTSVMSSQARGVDRGVNQEAAPAVDDAAHPGMRRPDAQIMQGVKGEADPAVTGVRIETDGEMRSMTNKNQSTAGPRLLCKRERNTAE